MNPRFCPVSMFVCVCVCVWGLCVCCHRGVLTSLTHQVPITRQPLPGFVLFVLVFAPLQWYVYTCARNEFAFALLVKTACCHFSSLTRDTHLFSSL
jgi:hypothetical protein